MQGSQDLSILYTALRTQRDLSSLVPISRQPGIGVHLSPILFRNHNFTSTRLHANLSVLLLNFANRIVVDLYWDSLSFIWQLCPLPLPAPSPTLPSSTSDSVSNTPSPEPSIVDVGGGIVCSSDRFGLDSVLKTVDGFLKNQTGTESDNIVTVVLNLKTLNLTAATSPPSFRTLGDQVALFDSVYTPTKLLSDRTAVNNSLASPYFFRSNTSTYSREISFPRQTIMSSRILVAIGSSALNSSSSYKSTNDNAYIFSAAELAGVPLISTTALSQSGVATCARPGANFSMQGTGFDLDYAMYSVPPTSVLPTDTVVSWNFPYIQDSNQTSFTAEMVSEIIQCGFAPIFTQSYTIGMLNATLWSWDVRQPSDDFRFNCALALISRGRWVVESCDIKYHVACVDLNTAPYSWSISPNVTSTFQNAEAVCKPPLTFAVPRTGPEQMAMMNAMRAANVSAAWVNFMRVSTLCWVQGWNTECPYIFTTEVLLARLLGANLKQGILILFIFALFLAYQARNQLRLSRESKRKVEVRKKIKQMEYKSIAKME